MANGYVYFIMQIHVFDETNARIYNVEMCICWNGYTFLITQEYGRNKSAPTSDGMFRGCFVEYSPPIHGTFVAAFQFVRHIIIIYVTHHRKPCATCLFRGCYAFWKQKPTFCTSKTILLKHKNPLFGVQKGGFYSVKKAGLHNKNKQPEKPLPVATMPNTHTPPHNNTTHSAHAYA